MIIFKLPKKYLLKNDKDFIKASKNYKNEGKSNEFLNKIIYSIYTLSISQVVSELRKASFITIIADEASDFNTNSFLSISFRYVLSNKVEERFYTLINVNESRNSEGIYKKIDEIVESLNIGGKPVGQVYDGAPTMSSEINGVQAKVKNKYKNCFFTNCVAHQMNLCLKKKPT